VPLFLLWSVGVWWLAWTQDYQKGLKVIGDEHKSLALVVLVSSPVLLKGSTRKELSSSSPTSRSALTPDSGLPSWVPPVILSVFSGTESLAANLGSTLVINSGGALSLPILGISLAMVEVVLVK
jgi:hypothetical protein